MKFKIGDKVVPSSKFGDVNALKRCAYWSYKTKPYLYVVRLNRDENIYSLNSEESARGGNYYKESDLELYIEPTMKQEKIKPQTFCITGKPHHLKAFVEDLKEIGYNDWGKHLEGSKFNYIGINNRKFEKAIPELTRLEYEGEPDKHFTLPSQYPEALQFCKEQKEIAENYFKKEEDFKIGDWVKFDVEKSRGSSLYTECWNNSHILQIDKIIGTSLEFNINFQLINNYANVGSISNKYTLFIKATDEEIKKELERREKLKFPKIIIGGYKGVFEKDFVKFGCNIIPKETFISFYEAIKQLPKNNFFTSMELTYQDNDFEVTFDQIKEIADYYTNK